MNTPFECERTLLVQADFDGELDAGQAAALVAHVAECAHCRSVQEQLVRARQLLRAAPRYAVPAALRESISSQAGRARSIPAASISRQTFSRSPSRLTSYGWGAALAAALLVAVVVRMPRTPDVEDQLVSNHLRALQLDSHLIDVPSSDHHTVKPWFAGRVDFAPVVKELDAQGYVLKGGRVDVLAGRTAAVLIYQAGRHTVEVFMWPSTVDAGALFESSRRDGFNLRHWTEGDLAVACISDMGGSELETFVERWRAAK
ncbi:MAG: zf-HC2 domain-containing protein [Gammaproteobacteria bacterium]